MPLPNAWPNRLGPFATIGTIGFEGRFDYAAIGTVANVASRLWDEAKPGQSSSVRAC